MFRPEAGPEPIEPDAGSGPIAVVRHDVSAAFASAFPGRFSVPEPFATERPIASDTTVAVPWRWHGTHEGPFADIPATGFEVDISGVTLLRTDEHGAVLHHRIVDWLHLYQQLGVVIGSRAPLDRTALLAESIGRAP